jgi:hypothetical protein
MAEEGALNLDGGPPGITARKDAPKPISAVAADFDGDDTLDLAVAFASGEVACYMNGGSGNISETPAVRLRLPKGRMGPLTVSIWQGSQFHFCVGTHVVTGHSPATRATLRKAAACVVRWRVPGGAARELRAESGVEVVLPWGTAP